MIRFFVVLCIIACVSCSDRLLLTDVKALTFHKGEMTKGRRSSPIPQLKCLSGSLCDEADIPAVQCQNVGDAGGGDVQWRCQATLPNGIEFGRTDVSCEGYANSEDPYVLKGSCGLEYTLRGGGASNSYRGSSYYDSYNYYASTPKSSRGGMSWVFLIIVAAGLYVIFFRRTNTGAQGGNRTAPSPYGSGGGGGGGYGGPGGDGGGGFRTSGGYTQTQQEFYQAPQQQAQQRQGPGFWTGLLGGMGMAYLLGNNRGYRGYGVGGYGGGGFRGFGGGGGGGGGHTGTGFGGTTRR